MQASWRFKVRRNDFSGYFIRRACATEFNGTDAEALEFAERVQSYLGENKAYAVEAHSVGPVDFSVPNAEQRRVIVRIGPDANGRDWLTEEGELMHGLWTHDLDSAVSYAFWRLDGRVGEIQVRDHVGQIQQIILAGKESNMLLYTKRI